MKNKIISAIMSIVITMCISTPVFATPNSAQLNESRQKYAEIENKIKEIENKIYDLNSQMEPLQETVEKNKREIENINRVSENTKKDIEKCRKEINELDLILGKRIKAMYASGDLEFNYLNFIIEAESTSEVFSRIEAVTKIVGKDKEFIESIEKKKASLNDKIKSLEEKKIELDKLNKEVKQNLNELDTKKKEQESLAKQAVAERSKFDAEYLSQLERDAVKTQFNVIDSSDSTSGDILGAINQLTNIRNNQIKSPIVTKEINDKIEKGKTAANKKKAAEQKEAADRARASQNNSSGSSTKSGSKNTSSVSVPASGNAQAVLNEAYSHLGKPYVWGATGAGTFDCSGFTQYVYQHAAGTNISRTTYTQINVGQAVSQDQLKPGDLVFPHAGHVGIYVGNGQMIHAPQTGDVVKVGPVYDFYAARRIL